VNNDDIVPLYDGEPDAPPPIALRQGIVQSWDAGTGANSVQFAGGTLVNVPALKSESVNLVAGDVVALLVTADQCLVIGKVITPGDPGTVPTWNGDIFALQSNVTTLNTVTVPAAQAAAVAAQVSADAAQADATTALSKFPIVATDITDGAISTPKLSANAIDGMTITGALFRTAASGQRIEIDSATRNEVKCFSGAASETAPGYLKSDLVSGGAFTTIASPEVAGVTGTATLNLQVIPSLGAQQAILTADNVSLSAGDWARLQAGSHIFEIDATGALALDGSTVLASGATGNVPQPVSVSDAPSLAVALSTTYAAGTPALGTAFTAPATGKVYITVGGRIRLDSNNNTMYLGYEVRAGATVGSGTVQQAADNGRAIAIGGNATGLTFVFGGSSRRLLLTGLTPGSSYNVRTMHACQTAGTVNGTLLNRDLLIEPVL
jgi:hypothetical protein